MAGTGGARDDDKDEEGLATVTNFAENMAGLMKRVHA
jgi:hypothetical protein